MYPAENRIDWARLILYFLIALGMGFLIGVFLVVGISAWSFLQLPMRWIRDLIYNHEHGGVAVMLGCFVIGEIIVAVVVMGYELYCRWRYGDRWSWIPRF